ncbi:MAG: matrixin family metalloprotease [Bacteriovoracia bacterium]
MRFSRLISVLGTLYLASGGSANAFTLNGSSALQGWSNSEITFNINYSGCTNFQSELNAQIDVAIALWNSVPNSGLKLVRGTSSTTTPAAAAASTASSTVTDGPLLLCTSNMSAIIDTLAGSTGNDSANIPGITKIDADGQLHVNYGAVFLNFESGKAANLQTLYASNPAIVAVVIAHEIGHALGFGHSAEEKALMYFSASQKNQLALAQDDIDAVAYLYPRSEFGSGFMGCGSLAVTEAMTGDDRGGGPPSAGAAAVAVQIALFFVFCLYVRRRAIAGAA